MSDQIKFLNEKQVAAMTGFSLSKLRVDRMKKAGIPYSKTGRSVRYNPADILSFMQSHRIETQV